MLRFFARKADPHEKLKETLKSFELPSFPAIAMKGLEVLRSESTTLVEAAEVLSADPGISTKLMCLVNSASSGLRRPARDLRQAVTLLGKGQVESLLTAIAVRNALPHVEDGHFEAQRFWRTSARRAAVARGLAGTLHPASRSLSYTGALLQDMAVPVLAASRGAAYGELLSQWRAERSSLSGLERELLGTDHAEVAGWLCQEWNLPAGLTGVIASHHEPEDDQDSAPAAVVLSALLCELDEAPEESEELIEAARTDYGLKPDKVCEVLTQGFEEAQEIARLFAG